MNRILLALGLSSFLLMACSPPKPATPQGANEDGSGPLVNGRHLLVTSSFGDSRHTGIEAGFSRSTNGGITWERFTASQMGLNWRSPTNVGVRGIYSFRKIIAVGSSGSGLALSFNNGNSWDIVTEGEDGFGANTVNDMIITRTHMYVATNDGLSISSDQGRTWMTVLKKEFEWQHNKVVQDISVLPDGTLYAATFGGVSISRDNGLTWETFLRGQNGLVDDFTFLAIDSSEDYVIAGSNKGGVSVSSDRGLTWTSTGPLENGFLADERVGAVAVGKQDLYAGTRAGLNISSDGGQTWSSIPWGYPGFGERQDWITSIREVEGDIYIGTLNQGLFVSEDGGSTWRCFDFTPEFPIRSIGGVYAFDN
ncbi:MAG: hypothetical protein AAF202_05690 [Pseudomonadota bacterium]